MCRTLYFKHQDALCILALSVLTKHALHRHYCPVSELWDVVVCGGKDQKLWKPDLLGLFIYILGLHSVWWGILVPQAGNEPVSPQWKPSLNQWTTREAPGCFAFKSRFFQLAVWAPDFNCLSLRLLFCKRVTVEVRGEKPHLQGT